MDSTIIKPARFQRIEKAGFTRFQFQRLDALYLRAMQAKVLMSRAVDCDFEEGILTFSYAKSDHHPPLFRFVVRQVGPRQVHYELYQQGKGRAFKSGIFERVYEKLEAEILALLPPDP
jgi:hypothetical protein